MARHFWAHTDLCSEAHGAVGRSAFGTSFGCKSSVAGAIGRRDGSPTSWGGSHSETSSGVCFAPQLPPPRYALLQHLQFVVGWNAVHSEAIPRYSPHLCHGGSAESSPRTLVCGGGCDGADGSAPRARAREHHLRLSRPCGQCSVDGGLLGGQHHQPQHHRGRSRWRWRW